MFWWLRAKAKSFPSCGHQTKVSDILVRAIVTAINQRHQPFHDDVIKWKHFPRYWPFVWGIHRSPVNSPHKGHLRGALIISLICAWINGWVNNREAGDFRRHRVYYGVIVMRWQCVSAFPQTFWNITYLVSFWRCHDINSYDLKLKRHFCQDKCGFDYSGYSSYNIGSNMTVTVTVYPTKCVHCSVVLCFALVTLSTWWSHDDYLPTFFWCNVSSLAPWQWYVLFFILFCTRPWDQLRGSRVDHQR